MWSDGRRVGDEESAGAFAAAIERAPRQLFGGGTSISGAIDYATTLFPRSPFRAPRRVIDISGDGSEQPGPLGHQSPATKPLPPASASTACRSSRSSPISTATTTTA